MKLTQGTEQEHRATLQRARKKGKTFYVWSGDIRRNAYLRENLEFGQKQKIIKCTAVESSQESGWDVEFLE